MRMKRVTKSLTIAFAKLPTNYQMLRKIFDTIDRDGEGPSEGDVSCQSRIARPFQQGSAARRLARSLLRKLTESSENRTHQTEESHPGT